MLFIMVSGTLGMAQRKRLRPKRWFVRARFLSKCGVGVAVCAGLLWGGYMAVTWLGRADYFRVRMIDIRGHTALSRQDIFYLLAIPEEAPLFQLDLRRMGARLERHPLVHTVALRREFPDTLRVAVQERTPRLVVVSGKQRVVIDQAGVVLRPVQLAQDRALPQLVLRRKPALAPGMRLRQADVHRALELIRAYEGSAVANTLRLVSLTVQDSGASRWTVAPYSFTLQVGEGSVEAQLNRLPPILRYLEQRGLTVQTVDVSYRKRVVVIPES